MVSRFKALHCCLWCKGTNFQANHNNDGYDITELATVAYGVKVLIFKQITTGTRIYFWHYVLLLMV